MLEFLNNKRLGEFNKKINKFILCNSTIISLTKYFHISVF